MKTIPFSFDPKESLELVQYHNPKLWGVDIVQPKLKIQTQVNSHNISYTKALGNCIRNCEDMAERILVMAAYQHIMDQKAIHYQNICNKITRVRLQEKALSNSILIQAKDRAPIFEFYAKQGEILEKEKALLLECPELRRHLQIQYDTAQEPKTQNS
ncbi:MAG TPA: hypothetical protein ENH87_03575 [Pricia antarctica]|uniref:Uncharacterized protein n=1 Tax=Pricia antarctica TaxID=641691 RepID=A0A831QNK0_9FLAO|nr:hypothetical protein [Pricia antarctica]